ncbi:hypothetical protein EN45_089950 [Penicillium chrysogenum]|uniref:Uncharacterized protein n=1 Tax=Penicillium chrysogenum TaxID=5076 RepID=A0A167QJD4_PENCH|nr:hypothetical protein EN45_089950 [Penicillium chrysogenum]
MRLPISNYEPGAEKATSRVAVDFASIADAATGCINQGISSWWVARKKSSALFVERDVDMDDTAPIAACASLIEDMLMAMKMSEFEDINGFIGSPEWFEEDIAHGNF